VWRLHCFLVVSGLYFSLLPGPSPKDSVSSWTIYFWVLLFRPMLPDKMVFPSSIEDALCAHVVPGFAAVLSEINCQSRYVQVSQTLTSLLPILRHIH
jgi:hypothetical protein